MGAPSLALHAALSSQAAKEAASLRKGGVLAVTNDARDRLKQCLQRAKASKARFDNLAPPSGFEALPWPSELWSDLDDVKKRCALARKASSSLKDKKKADEILEEVQKVIDLALIDQRIKGFLKGQGGKAALPALEDASPKEDSEATPIRKGGKTAAASASSAEKIEKRGSGKQTAAKNDKTSTKRARSSGASDVASTSDKKPKKHKP